MSGQTPAFSICLIVAHPDDEALWVGGTLLQLQRTHQRVFVVGATHGSDALRSAEFSNACSLAGCQGLLLDLPDDGGHTKLPDFRRVLDKSLRGLGISPRDFDLVMTHAPHGNERGHADHIWCYRYTKAWSRQHGIPLAFFAECQLPLLGGSVLTCAQSEGGDGLTTNWTSRMLRRQWSNVKERQNKAVVATAKHAIRVIWDLLSVKAVIVNTVDLAAKQQLLGCYTSQRAGLSDYQMYSQATEYLYFEDPAQAKAMFELLCPLS